MFLFNFERWWPQPPQINPEAFPTVPINEQISTTFSDKFVKWHKKNYGLKATEYLEKLHYFFKNNVTLINQTDAELYLPDLKDRVSKINKNHPINEEIEKIRLSLNSGLDLTLLPVDMLNYIIMWVEEPERWRIALTDSKFNLLMQNPQFYKVFLQKYETTLSLNKKIRLAQLAGNSLNSLDLSNTDLSDSDLEKICLSCPHLKELNLANCKELTSIGFDHIAEGCPQLTHINFYGCEKLTNMNMYSITRKNPNLIYINIGQCSLKDTTLTNIAAHCPKIETLICDFVDTFTDKGFIQISLSCLKLKNLSLRGCDQISDEALNCFAKNLVDLRHLNLFGCFNLINLEKIGDFPELRSLDLSENKNINDRNMYFITKNCKYLEVLMLQACSINDKTLDIVIQSCPLIHTIDLSGAEEEGSHLTIQQLGKFSHLKSLNLGGLQFPEEDFLELVATFPVNLQTLNLFACDIKYSSLIALSSKCPNLQSIDISFCEQITEMGMICLLTKFEEFQSLDLSTLSEISIQIFSIITIYDPKPQKNLQTLKLNLLEEERNDPIKVRKAITKIGKRFPNLKNLFLGLINDSIRNSQRVQEVLERYQITLMKK